ncbi:MAG: NAD(P)H-dependent glycerol-3-phosphate dehydrogenase, partial [Sphaerochaetaceae bacterium]
EEDVIEDINTNHQNSKYFPGRFINNCITATNDISCTYTADILFLAVPSKVIESFCHSIVKEAKEEMLVINLSKGLAEDGSFLIEKISFKRTGSLKGPTFAVEIMNGDPSGMTFGGSKDDYNELKETLKKTAITIDYSSDARAVDFLSVLKNMYAIAIGIVSGRYNSPNVDFLVMTKAVNEMRRLLKLYDCNEETIFNYCGIGDLGLTALNDLSRNRTLGLLIGKGFSNDPKSTTVIEGLRTIKLLGKLVRDKNIQDDFIVLDSLYSLLYNGSSLNDYYLSVLA